MYNGKDKNIQTYLKSRKLVQEQLKIEEVPFQNNRLIIDELSSFDMSSCSLQGPHNRFNCFCAITVAKRLGVDDEIIQMGLNTFINAPHRMEQVATIDEVQFINDSKATNVDAVYYALLSMEQPVVWVVGGIDKGNDYNIILPLVKEKVKAIICLGADNTRIKEAFEYLGRPIEETQQTKKAIQLARKYATSGDVVLLSPACSSFDLFKNYEARGDQFREAVLELRD